MTALLDVSVLVALLDQDHVDHTHARAWLTANADDGWASCVLTQNGFVRIVSQPRYPNPATPAEAIARLRGATETRYHRFWPSDLAITDRSTVDASRLYGPGQVTDVYLLALAVAHDARFVTFDQSIQLAPVVGAQPRHLVVL